MEEFDLPLWLTSVDSALLAEPVPLDLVLPLFRLKLFFRNLDKAAEQRIEFRLGLDFIGHADYFDIKGIVQKTVVLTEVF